MFFSGIVQICGKIRSNFFSIKKKKIILKTQWQIQRRLAQNREAARKSRLRKKVRTKIVAFNFQVSIAITKQR